MVALNETLLCVFLYTMKLFLCSCVLFGEILLDERRIVGGCVHVPVKGQRGSWTILLVLERYRHHLCPYLLWNTCSVFTMSKRSIVHWFLVQHGFSNYLSYCRSVLIALVCICACGGGWGDRRGSDNWQRWRSLLLNLMLSRTSHSFCN